MTWAASRNFTTLFALLSMYYEERMALERHFSHFLISECQRDGDEEQHLHLFGRASWKIKKRGRSAVGQVLRHSSEPILQRPSLAFHRIPRIGGDQRGLHPRSWMRRRQYGVSHLGNEYVARIESVVLRLFQGNAWKPSARWNVDKVCANNFY